MIAISNNNLKNNSKGTCSNNNIDNNTSQKVGLGLAKFSYGDFVVLSSVLSYAIAEELNETDLELLVAFLGMVSSDLAILIIKKGLEEAKQNEAVDTTVQEISEEDITSQLVRKSNCKKIKKIKKVEHKKTKKQKCN